MKQELCIVDITTEIVDIPTIRKHRLSSVAVTKQTFVIVKIILGNGVIGIGEGTTLGGPVWSEEFPEGIKIVIDQYLKPYLLKQKAEDFQTINTILNRSAKRNNAAKSAVFMAILDGLGKSRNVPAWSLLGKAHHTSFPVLWALASGDADQETEEALSKIDARLHNEFKIKIGINAPEDDLKRLIKITEGIKGKGVIKVVDANQAWDLETAKKYIPRLQEIGVQIIEQPLPAWDLNGMKNLSKDFSINIMADESVFDIHEAKKWFSQESVNSISLKLVKHANPMHMQAIAKVALESNIQLYGGCLLESSIGTAAHLHTFATLPEITLGTESFGPLILEENLSREHIVYENFQVKVPEGSGLGITLNDELVKEYKRD